jgi:dephospho-CoA kinase
MVRSALRERWAETVFRADGSVDRKAIAKRVFEDKTELDWLESLLHPSVRNTWETALAEAPDRYWLVEIPLLFEKKLETKFDSTICIEASPVAVKKRMISRGYSPSEIRQRCQFQMPLKEKICRSDYVISNSGSLEFLKLQIKQLIQQIQ